MVSNPFPLKEAKMKLVVVDLEAHSLGHFQTQKKVDFLEEPDSTWFRERSEWGNVFQELLSRSSKSNLVVTTRIVEVGNYMTYWMIVMY